MDTPIVDFVRRYAQQRTTRMHMPGHKGRGPLGCEALDITEIAGADELYEAEGIIARSEANAAQLFGTARTCYSTEGSSQCIRAMLHLALQMQPAGASRPVLLAARNAHKALLYAAALLDFDIQWLWPAPDAAGALCTCPVEPEALACALDGLTAEGRTPFGVYLTSPDYLGFVQDIAGLAAVCHAHGVPLLVDNAHGAYLHFLKEGSRHPIQLGADLCCDSAHKTLPVLTGGAYLHLGPSVQADEAAVRNALALFGSTSPSYLILQSLDAAVLGLSGQQLAQALREQGVECEYADPRYLVLMPSPESSAEDFARLQKALHALCAEASSAAPASDSDAAAFAALAEALQAQPRPAAIREAVLAPQEMVPAAEAVGRICAAPAVSCPPAVPIVVSGEIIPAQALPLFARYGIGRVAVVKD